MTLTSLLQSETTISLQDIKLFGVFIPVFCLYRVLISKFLLKPLSKTVPESCRFKYIHRGFDFIHYLTASIIGTIAFMGRPYAKCPFYFVGCDKYIYCTGESFVCSILEKIYFIYFACYYFSDVFWIHTTKDVAMLVVHHIITVSMILITAISSRPVVGLSTMLLHDWVDVFLYFGKLASYYGWKKLADTSLLTMAALFYYLRIFGVFCILKSVWTDKEVQPHHYQLWLVGRCLLIGLYICHLIWGYQIASSLIKIALSKGEQDIRDTRSDEGDSPKQKKE